MARRSAWEWNVKRNVETRKGDISVDDAGSRARTEIVLINATGPGGLGRCGLGDALPLATTLLL